LTRNNPQGEIGFLSDIRRINVGMTRARRKLSLASRLKKACSRGQHPGAIANGRDEGVTKLLF
jgi:superfamily I DNA and/or RNA helicase